MADPVFPLEKFRLLYTVYAGVSDEVVIATADEALCLTSARGCGCAKPEQYSQWMLMTAHLLYMAALDAKGQFAPGILSGATIDKITTSFAMPPITTPWQFWLARSPYGQQFQAMLSRCAAMGMYVGGSPERSAFRTVAGRFPGWFGR